DLFLFLNNDVEFFDDSSLCKMLELFQCDHLISIVGARLLYKNTNILQHAGVIFSPKYNCLPYHFKHKEISKPQDEKNKYFQAVTAAVCLTKFSDFQKVG